MKVKICGLRRPEDAVAAAEAGADFVSMIFAPARRRIDAGQGAAITAAVRKYAAEAGREPPRFVGIFVDQDPATINATAREAGLDYVQLSGHESAEVMAAIDRPVIKVLRLDGDAAVERVTAEAEALSRRFPSMTFAVENAAGPGGTGVPTSLDLAARLGGRFDFLLAGGLKPETVAAAVERVRPWGVDVSSGVESDGEKDAVKIRKFVERAKSVPEGAL